METTNILMVIAAVLTSIGVLLKGIGSLLDGLIKWRTMKNSQSNRSKKNLRETILKRLDQLILLFQFSIDVLCAFIFLWAMRMLGKMVYMSEPLTSGMTAAIAFFSCCMIVSGIQLITTFSKLRNFQ